MACREKGRTLKVLRGELGVRDAARSLDHVRACGECREAFRFAASTLTKHAASEAEASYEGSPAGDSGGPSRRSSTLGGLVGGRKVRSILILCVVAMIVIGVASGGFGKQAARARVASNEEQWRVLLARGIPVCTSPDGEHEGRPRAVLALVPPATGAVRLIFVDDSGKVIHEREFSAGKDGCFIEEIEVVAEGGTFRAGRVMLPFPDQESLALEPGIAAGVMIAVPGGHVSASTVYRVRRG